VRNQKAIIYSVRVNMVIPSALQQRTFNWSWLSSSSGAAAGTRKNSKWCKEPRQFVSSMTCWNRAPLVLLVCLLLVLFNFATIPEQQQFFPEENTGSKKQQSEDGKQQMITAAPVLAPSLLAKQKQVGQSQIQLSHATSMNRYPDEYSAVKEYFDKLSSKEYGKESSGKKLRTAALSREGGADVTKKTNASLLSFGSSTGEEAITLATMYFKNDTKFNIFGVDLDQVSLDKAKVTVNTQYPELVKDGKVTFFNGKEVDISEYGPYDAIFANSVFCYHGKRGITPKSIVEKYPFSDFEASLGYLDANLNVGGILAIVNTNYHFSHAEELYKKYRPISKCANFVPKVDIQNVSFEKHEDENKLLVDCVWVKESV